MSTSKRIHKQTHQLYDYVSSSAIYGVAKNFSQQNIDRCQPKTILKSVQPQLLRSGHGPVDVSWISPFPYEQEMILVPQGIAILKPHQLLCPQNSSCRGHKLDCIHAKETCFLKIVTINTRRNSPEYLQDLERGLQQKYLSILKTKLQTYMEHLRNGMHSCKSVKGFEL